MNPMQADDYTGIENLEVMQEAVNYNRYLLGAICRHAQPGTRTLDFGAGTGQFAIPLQQLRIDVTAVEPDRSLQRRLAAHGIPTCSSADELPAESFDVIYSLNVLEHIVDDVGALRQLHAVLKPRGTLLVYVPAFAMLYSSMDAKVGHVRRYTRTSLRAVVARAGFEVQRVGYVDSLGFFAALAFKLFDRGGGEVNRRALKIYDRAIFPVSAALDVIATHWFGKNLLLIAHK
jgi:SAM-dependent methyltransferase